MLLNELFDTPYKLIPNTRFAKQVAREVLATGHGNDGLLAYGVAGDDSQAFFLLKGDGGLWEVHHAKKLKNGRIISGGISPEGKAGPNPKFISTAIQLYKSSIENGQPIRVVSPTHFWPAYSAFIKRMVRIHHLTVEPEITNMAPIGVEYVSQVIRPPKK